MKQWVCDDSVILSGTGIVASLSGDERPAVLQRATQLSRFNEDLAVLEFEPPAPVLSTGNGVTRVNDPPFFNHLPI